MADIDKLMKIVSSMVPESNVSLSLHKKSSLYIASADGLASGDVTAHGALSSLVNAIISRAKTSLEASSNVLDKADEINKEVASASDDASADVAVSSVDAIK